ncbi:hypothetical protein F4553_005328 [Allocatelliglobosispora scoriae]|uniref:Uncharacterized protein n=1 Tax=Allocatelliglobosispora scoriae TaxID=643052 RepID=A0A841BXT7_9ACTN|nr:hypothetical protein [Allocatelliglobosispora scoriae]MBB5871949.1 hypothetical protein [Allocatelliglobosispora scoriae]
MYRTYRNPYERACDCTCPAHHGQQRWTYNDPGCHCLATCASQPMILLTPEVGGAMFLNYHGALWYVPALEPGHWDWRYATPVDVGHPLFDAADLIIDLLRDTHKALLPLIHRM